jgi:hypothetical protein
MNYARMKHRSETYADIIDELDESLGSFSDLSSSQNKDYVRFLDKLITSSMQRRTGGYARHASTNETKALMKQAWLLMREHYRQVNGKPDKLGFADDMFDCFGIPKDVKSIYPWIKKWESEK